MNRLHSMKKKANFVTSSQDKGIFMYIDCETARIGIHIS